MSADAGARVPIRINIQVRNGHAWVYCHRQGESHYTVEKFPAEAVQVIVDEFVAAGFEVTR